MCLTVESLVGATGWAALLSIGLWIWAAVRFLRRKDRRQLRPIHEVASWLTITTILAVDVVIVLRYQYHLPTDPTKYATAFTIGLGIVAAIAWIKAGKDWRG
jgi:hypothetical protein